MIIKTEKDTVQSYFEDQSGLSGGHAHTVYIAERESEIAEFLEEMSKTKTPVTISGSGTGVTGGRIPFGGVVLSLERLNKIIQIKKISGDEACAVVQSAVRVSDLKKEADKQGWLYPPDPTEQNSFIGGNISTNASGSRGFKYGSTRKYVRRLKVILSNGATLDISRGNVFASGKGVIKVPIEKGDIVVDLGKYELPEIKNAAGYFNYPGMDLIDLFIGSEGTLGVVVEAEMTLKPRIEKIFGGVAFFPDKKAAWDFALEIRKTSLVSRKHKAVSEIDALSLEYLDNNALDLLKGDYPQIPDFAQACVMFEQDISLSDADKVTGYWTAALEKYKAPLEKVWLGASVSEQEMFREFRHRMPEKVNEIVRKNGFPKTGTDIAVSQEHLVELLEYYYKIAGASGIDHLVFGHIGDCHMHANFLPKNEIEFNKCIELYKRLVELAVKLKGTVSAEHGIGKLKHIYLEKMIGTKGMSELARVKKAFDPALILGRGNIFPEELLKTL